MPIAIAHLGPTGTYSETAALNYAQSWQKQHQQDFELHPYSTIAQTLQAIANQQADIAVVPVENSIEGSVTMTLDTLWQLDQLQIQQAVVLPIVHTLVSIAPNLEAIQTVYSHPQALAQCQTWLRINLPTAELIPTNSTTEALQHLSQHPTTAAISSERAAKLYDLPMLARSINDHPDNCTRFWILGADLSSEGQHSSLAFSLLANQPGALVKALQIFAARNINLSRIESRPTKRSLGDYLFFIDIEANMKDMAVQSALLELQDYTEKLKCFGSYNLVSIAPSA
ncbi:MAG: prephenate dehydratase [Oculatellaceae cyanobacterium Prado106]|jgi:prephenate dehydratase|nr:prephenate dehydratase [Oculatellaceae cyanobacterium Prado106]